MAITLVAFPACETQRTVKSVQRGTFSFDPNDKAWNQGAGKKGTVTSKEEEEGKKKITKKFLNAGFKKDEETGDLMVENNNLFSGESSKLGNKSFRSGKKDAKIRSREAQKKVFETPEYLKRSKFQGANETARETGLFVKEDSTGSSQFGTTVKKKEAGLLQRVNPFAQKSYAGSNESFAKFNNRAASRAQQNSPVADGIKRQAGFMDQTKMSVDDVKRLLNPSEYAKARGL